MCAPPHRRRRFRWRPPFKVRTIYIVVSVVAQRSQSIEIALQSHERARSGRLIMRCRWLARIHSRATLPRDSRGIHTRKQCRMCCALAVGIDIMKSQHSAQHAGHFNSAPAHTTFEHSVAQRHDQTIANIGHTVKPRCIYAQCPSAAQ